MATAARVAEVLGSYRYRYDNEKELQDGLEAALVGAGVGFQREEPLAPGDIPDFLVAGGIAVEVKVDGSFSEILRQLMRYALAPQVEGLVLVTRKAQHARRFPERIAGKPLAVVCLGDQSL